MVSVGNCDQPCLGLPDVSLELWRTGWQMPGLWAEEAYRTVGESEDCAEILLREGKATRVINVTKQVKKDIYMLFA